MSEVRAILSELGAFVMVVAVVAAFLAAVLFIGVECGVVTYQQGHLSCVVAQ